MNLRGKYVSLKVALQETVIRQEEGSYNRYTFELGLYQTSTISLAVESTKIHTSFSSYLLVHSYLPFFYRSKYCGPSIREFRVHKTWYFLFYFLFTHFLHLLSSTPSQVFYSTLLSLNAVPSLIRHCVLCSQSLICIG